MNRIKLKQLKLPIALQRQPVDNFLKKWFLNLIQILWRGYDQVNRQRNEPAATANRCVAAWSFVNVPLQFSAHFV